MLSSESLGTLICEHRALTWQIDLSKALNAQALELDHFRNQFRYSIKHKSAKKVKYIKDKLL